MGQPCHFHTCHSVSHWLATNPAPQGALIDIRFPDDSCELPGRTPSERGVPFLHHPTWGDTALSNGSPQLSKPSSFADTLAALTHLLAQRLVSKLPASNAG